MAIDSHDNYNDYIYTVRGPFFLRIKARVVRLSPRLCVPETMPSWARGATLERSCHPRYDGGVPRGRSTRAIDRKHVPVST